MCGIVGKLFFTQEKQVSDDVLKKMTRELEHRGPDDEGYYLKGQIGLGHRRLSIIDLTDAASQPMCNEDKTIWIVFNGEIYNFQELRQILEKKGHIFSSNSDTETIIHLYEEYGVDCLQYLRGMFSFAIWDDKNKKIFLARDRVGQKPLKYFLGEDYIIFGSELKAILKDPAVPREVDYEAVHHYLTYQYVPNPLTGFQGIKKLAPGHYITIDVSGTKPIIEEQKRYWQLDYTNKIDLSENEWKHEIIKKLEEAVKIRMISDVPLGAFLSGGIDSSTVVALMAKNSMKPVNTFSIGFKEKSHTELPYAKRIAEKYNTNHKEFIVEPKGLEILPKLIYHFEEPYADSSAMPTYYVSQLARKHVTVALNGDGGDESFAGYPWYGVHKMAKFYEKIPVTLQRFASHVLKMNHHYMKSNSSYRALRFANGIGETAQERYLRYMAYFHPDEKSALYTPEFTEQVRGANTARFITELFDQAKNFELVDQALYTDVHSYLPDDLLVKVDIATMSNSLEARSPFLDHEFMELIARMPSKLKLHRFEQKYILKRAIEPLVPKENIYRKKMGFGVPIEHWFRGKEEKYISSILLSKKSFIRKLVNENAIRKLLHEHKNTKINHSNRLWALLTLEMWHSEFFKVT